MSFSPSKAADDEPIAAIGAGHYLLRMQSKSFPEHQPEVSVPLVTGGPKLTKPKDVEKFWIFEWHTDKEWDIPPRKSFSGEGVYFQSEVKFGFTAPERENILMYHYLGKVGDDGIAHGKFTCFVDGAKAFDGKWSLKERVKKADEPERNGDSD